MKKKTIRINKRYIPKNLSSKDKQYQKNMILKSRKLYKKGKYFTRRKVKSFKSKTSSHIINAKNKYNVSIIGATNELSKHSGCSKKSLAKIINKGAGAYYSSGSRPNQTAQSWGIARLASALTSGKAGAIDYNILINGCKKGSLGYKSAKNARRKYGKGQSHIPKV
jgi:hypothetical protein